MEKETVSNVTELLNPAHQKLYCAGGTNQIEAIRLQIKTELAIILGFKIAIEDGFPLEFCQEKIVSAQKKLQFLEKALETFD